MHEVLEETRSFLKIITPGHLYLSKEQHGLEVNSPSLPPFTACWFGTPIWRWQLQRVTGMGGSQPPLGLGTTTEPGQPPVPPTGRARALEDIDLTEKHQSTLVKPTISLAALLIYRSFLPVLLPWPSC